MKSNIKFARLKTYSFSGVPLDALELQKHTPSLAQNRNEQNAHFCSVALVHQGTILPELVNNSIVIGWEN